jgi:hypothetical protein
MNRALSNKIIVLLIILQCKVIENNQNQHIYKIYKQKLISIHQIIAFKSIK